MSGQRLHELVKRGSRAAVVPRGAAGLEQRVHAGDLVERGLAILPAKRRHEPTAPGDPARDGSTIQRVVEVVPRIDVVHRDRPFVIHRALDPRTDGPARAWRWCVLLAGGRQKAAKRAHRAEGPPRLACPVLALTTEIPDREALGVAAAHHGDERA